MQRTWVALCCSLFIILLLAGCSSSTPPAVKKPPHNVGLIPFEAHAGVQPGEVASVSELFASALQQTNRFVVVDRKTINAMMQERDFQASQDDNAQMAKSGKVLSMKKMISGSVGRLGNKYIMNIKMIDVESTLVDLAISQAYDGELSEIGEEFIPEIVSQLLQAIDGSPKK